MPRFRSAQVLNVSPGSLQSLSLVPRTPSRPRPFPLVASEELNAANKAELVGRQQATSLAAEETKPSATAR